MLEAAFTERTRFVVLNNPINPAGVVLPEADLALLAEFCVAHDAVAICDEVWEQVVFGNAVHRPLIAFPGMREAHREDRLGGQDVRPDGWKVGSSAPHRN